MRLFLLQNF